MTATIDLTVHHEVGLHARPASMFVATASKFSSKVTVANVTREKAPVDAKSILMVLTSGVEHNHVIRITAEGEDEEEAVAALTDLVEANFGE